MGRIELANAIADMKSLPPKRGLRSPAIAPMRVAVVDDSGVVRKVIAGWIDSFAGVQLSGQFADAESFMAAMERDRPDLVIMDIEMPGLDGLSAARHAIARNPELVVLITTGTARRVADIVAQCLSAGAVDVVLKPIGIDLRDGVESYREALSSRIAAIGAARRRRLLHAGMTPRVEGAEPPSRPLSGVTGADARDILLIGASTGGPRAILELLTSIGDGLDRLAVVIVQHIPESFSHSFARHLSSELKRQVQVCGGGEMLDKGVILLAPTGRHVEVRRSGDGLATVLTDAEPVNYCRPSADVLFRSMARWAADRAIGVILTGMGRDGAAGAAALYAEAAPIFAQDEQSSVVWGMPGAVVRTGHATAQYSPLAMGREVARLAAAGKVR